MNVCIDKRAWLPQFAIVVAVALTWILPARAASCNALRSNGQSLTLQWDEGTIADCLSEAEKLKTEMDHDPVEAAFHAMDDICAQLETNHLPGDFPETAGKVCAKLRAGIKTEPTH
jgi:hypothetical protein